LKNFSFSQNEKMTMIPTAKIIHTTSIQSTTIDEIHAMQP